MRLIYLVGAINNREIYFFFQMDRLFLVSFEFFFGNRSIARNYGIYFSVLKNSYHSDINKKNSSKILIFLQFNYIF